MDFYDEKMTEWARRWNAQTDNFGTANGICITGMDGERGEGKMVLDRSKMNPNGTVHGGALYTLADTVAGITARTWAMLHRGGNMEGISCTTVTGTLNYLRAATGSAVVCTASPRKVGEHLAVMDVSITNDREIEVCSGTFTFYFIDRARYMAENT